MSTGTEYRLDGSTLSAFSVYTGKSLHETVDTVCISSLRHCLHFLPTIREMLFDQLQLEFLGLTAASGNFNFQET